MAGHRYWRLRQPYSGGLQFGLSALAFRDASGTLIPTAGGTAIESGHATTHVAAFAFDGLDATVWEGNGADNVWIGYQFATAKDVRQVGLQRAASMDGDNPPVEALVEYSDGGNTWTVAAWLITGTFVNDVMKWFDFTNIIQLTFPRMDFGAHAYWKMHDILPTNGVWTALSEILFKDDTGALVSRVGAVATESGHFGAFSAANLIDGNNATFWESSNIGNASWVAIQLAAPAKVMQIALQRAASMDGSDPPVSCRIDFSDDGVTWGVAAWLIVGAMVNDTPKWFNLAGALN